MYLCVCVCVCVCVSLQFVQRRRFYVLRFLIKHHFEENNKG